MGWYLTENYAWLLFLVPGVITAILGMHELVQRRAALVRRADDVAVPGAPDVLSYASPQTTKTRGASQWLRVPIAVLLVYPVVFGTLCAAFVLLAALKLGHWPRSSLDDPKSVGLDPLYIAIYYGMLGGMPAQAAAVVLYAMVRPPRPYPWLAIAFGAFSLGIYAQEPIVGFWYWYFD